MCLYLCDFLHSSNSAVTPDVASVVLTFTARVGLLSVGHSSIVGAWTLSVSCAIFSPNVGRHRAVRASTRGET